MDATTTQHTLVAIFRDRDAADAAVADLRSNGFSASETLSGDSSSVYTGTSNTERQHEGGIVGWFKHLFGEDDNPDRNTYEQAYERGEYLVTAYVEGAELDRAADILNQHSPVNIERDATSGDIDDADYVAGENDTAYAGGASTTTSRTAANVAGAAGATAGAFAGRAASATRNAERDVAQGARNLTGTENTATGAKAGENRTIPVVAEELKIGKRAFQRGGVRIYSRIIEQPVEEQVRLRDERVRVDRVPVNRETQAGDLEAGREQVYEVKEYAEEPVVSKQARVVEEVRVGKEANERVETVRETVRRTEVNVENLGNQAAAAGTKAGSYTGTTAGNVRSNDDYYRQSFATQSEFAGQNYDDYAPAYQYGETIAGDPRYSGRSWDEIEPQIRSEYASRYPNSAWDRAKIAVRTGWNRLTAKAHNI